jgi:hypothetical protein
MGMDVAMSTPTLGAVAPVYGAPLANANTQAQGGGAVSPPVIDPVTLVPVLQQLVTALQALVDAIAGAQALGGGRLTGADPNRQGLVAERGTQVMPFDLERTMHSFQTTAYGGLQEVYAKDPADTQQVQLVRGHLQQIAASMSEGDFSSQAAIHDTTMPGLTQMQARFRELKVEYRETPAGAQLVYSAPNAPDLVPAIHDYFNAQNTDHGRHAGH